MRETTLKSKVLSFVLMIALFVSITPILTGGAYADTGVSPVQILKSDGKPAVKTIDYEISGSTYTLISSDLKVTTEGQECNATIVLGETVSNVIFDDCKLNTTNDACVKNDNSSNIDQTITIVDNCSFESKKNAIDFNYQNNHKLIIKGWGNSADLDIRTSENAINVEKGALEITGEINANLIAEGSNTINVVDGNLHTKGNANIVIKSKNTAIHADSLFLEDNSNVYAESDNYQAVVVKETATINTIGKITLIGNNAAGIKSINLEISNKEGTTLIRGRNPGAVAMGTTDSIKLGRTIKMYSSTDFYSLTTELEDNSFTYIENIESNIQWFYPAISNECIKTVLFKGKTRAEEMAEELEQAQKDIEQAQQEIDNAQEELAKEKAARAKEVAELESEIAAMEKKMSETQKANDAEFMELNKSLMSINKNPVATMGEDGLVKLTWEEIPRATGYDVYVPNEAGIDELVATVTTTEYRAAPSGEYRIKAFTTINKEKIYGEAQTVKTKMVKNSVKSFKSTGKKKVVVKFSKVPGAQIYEVRYKVSGKNWKTVVAKGTSKTIKKLKSRKKCYVKVRGVYAAGQVKIVSPWTTVKTVKVR